MITITDPNGNDIAIGGSIEVALLVREIVRVTKNGFHHLYGLSTADGLKYTPDEWDALQREATRFLSEHPATPQGVRNLLERLSAPAAK